jgi:predicted GNAT family acetyltransferase
VIGFSPLDNPVWMSLTTGHVSLAQSAGLARRYASDVSPLAGLQSPVPAAFSDLCALVGSGESVGIVTPVPLEPTSDWQVVRTRPIEQMICTETAHTPTASIPELRQSDVPEMLALAAATEPGPFLPQTIQMGRYIGIRSGDGRLIAMAGERLRLKNFIEISAVCTDPEFRGRGHAWALVVFLVRQILAEGAVPFLHVKAENGAKALYEKIGFRVRRTVHLTVIARQ